MSRSRDVAQILGKTDAANVDNHALLDTSAGVDSAEVVTLITAHSSNFDSADIQIISAPLTNRNLIINGAMVVAQRATSATGITGGGLNTVDRMYPEISNAGTWTQSQSTDVPVGQGFVNSFKMDCTTADTSLDAGHYNILGYRIEGIDLQRLNYGTSGAKNMVLSFWVKTSKTGNYVVNIQNIVTGGTSRTCGKVYTVSQANTWQKVEFPIAADTAAAFDNDTALTAIIYWWLATGTTYTSGTLSNTWENISNPNIAAGQTVNLADSTSNNFYITGIQLEEGDVATAFEHEDYGTTLRKCQRYYQSVDHYYSSGSASVNAFYYTPLYFPISMRATPTMTASAWNSNTGNATSYHSSTLVNGWILVSAAPTAVLVRGNHSNAYNLLSGRGKFNAEI